MEEVLSQNQSRKVSAFGKLFHFRREWKNLNLAVQQHTNREELLARRRIDIDYVTRERRKNYKNRDCAILDQTNDCSMTFDGAEKLAFEMPHFFSKRKKERGNSIKARLTALLDNNQKSQPHLYKMTEEHDTLWRFYI